MRNTFHMHGVASLFIFFSEDRQPGAPERAVVGVASYSYITHVRNEKHGEMNDSLLSIMRTMHIACVGYAPITSFMLKGSKCSLEGNFPRGLLSLKRLLHEM